QERLADYVTNNGPFVEGRFIIHEHFGTHVDAPAHVQNNAETLETKTPDLRTAEELTVEDLYGPVIYIDIEDRVQAVLDSNKGRPGPVSVTDFSDKSKVGITVQDIEKVEHKIKDGVWIVVNSNWSQFFHEEPNMEKSAYINNWNYPGFSRDACDKLIEIENKKGVRINGLVMDNLSVGSGDNGTGVNNDWVDPWRCHIRGIQRGWLLVENATNIGGLSKAKPDSCNLFVGAIKLVSAAGVPSRVVAICES
ncbi:MAG: cyclase family protein, partial [Cellvibrionaceae bacterium]|nr:cyclase family protein [Cellvibrionaceae bacterium]